MPYEEITPIRFESTLSTKDIKASKKLMQLATDISFTCANSINEIKSGYIQGGDTSLNEITKEEDFKGMPQRPLSINYKAIRHFVDKLEQLEQQYINEFERLNPQS